MPTIIHQLALVAMSALTGYALARMVQPRYKTRPTSKANRGSSPRSYTVTFADGKVTTCDATAARCSLHCHFVDSVTLNH